MIKNYHDSCNFDITNCPDRELENQWSQRQEALSKTIEQGYAQYNQEFHLTPQTAGFLATHGIDYNDYQGFCGTALQQQLHGEMCDLFSEAAIMQLQFSHQKNLLTSIVDFVDAAHDANKNKQVLLASQLMSVGWIGFKLNRQIVDAAIPYGKAGVSGIVHSATGFLNMAAHPIETFKGLCKAIYFALETMAANDPEPLFDNPELRDQINAKVAAGLKILGEKMANSTGPERFGALTSIVADSVIPGKIIHAVGGVCGIVRSQAKGMRSLEGIASLAEDQGVAREVMQAAELEIAVQEKVAKTLASELMEAGKNGGKVASGSKATPPRTFADKKASALRKAQRIEKITETLPDGRIRYYEAERPSSTPGPTRGRSFVTEFDPKTGRVRQWNEYYNHCGNVNRVRPKMINGRTVVSQHYPATYADIQNNIKGSKWHIPEKTLD
ncbi:MAG: hypothetical protein NTZ68_04430 [Candidatus Dependentiae bacterium]|nr:hypothetical protein [Candidatus Dependentiae bacterium]